MQHVIKQVDALTTQENGISRFHEYRFDFKQASLGISEIDGRYPERGFDVDKQVEQSWYVERGEAVIWIAGQEYRVEQGDMVHLAPGEKYWIEGVNLRLVVASSPIWFEEQHKHLDT